jgi:hypothetical protein
MTRLSATATIAALLLLAIAQGFGATKVTTKSTARVATKSTAKPYHITAQNQFHFKSKKLSAARAARLSQPKAQKLIGPQTNDHVDRAMSHMPPIKHTRANARAMKLRRNQANPPVGHLGFVSATQVSAGGYLGDTNNQVLAGTLGGATAFITVVDTGAGCAYSEVVANGDGTFTTVVPASPATLTLVPDPVTTVAGDDCGPTFIVGDLDGDGNTDIVQADNPGFATILLSNGDGTFTATAGSPFTVTANSFTGGTLVTNATSTFLDIVFVDGIPGNAAASNIVTVPGNGDGTFGTPGTPVPLVPAAGQLGNGFNVIITDFDGDGTVDVAENDWNTNQQNVYLSSTATTPYTGAPLTTPNGVDDACTATAGSLTGSPAIVEVNCDDETITVYNNAAGVFSEGVYYPALVTASTTAVTVPWAATIADVNGDGNGDVVITNELAGITVLLGNGDGTLQLASVAYGTGGEPYAPAVVMDLNGDTLADVLVEDDKFSLTWMAGYGDGTFQSSKSYYTQTANCCADAITVASGDFNGDGFTDLVVANVGNTAVGITVYLSNPDGSLQPGVNYGSGGGMEFAAVADFNGDGNLDIAASDYLNGAVQIFTGTGSGAFVEGPSYSTGGPSPAGIVAADFDGANGVDLAVVDGEVGLVSVLFNDGVGGFTNVVPLTLSAGGFTLAAADLNGDTTPDLVISESDSDLNVGVLLNGPTATEGTFGAETLWSVGGESLGLAVADVNGDGFPDIVTPVSELQNIAVLFGKGDGTFATSATFPTNPIYLATSLADPTFVFTNPEPFFVQIADVDGDTFPDLVYSNAGYGTVGVLFGTGTGSQGATPAPYFFDPVEFPATLLNIGVGLADVNGDGAPDAATVSEEAAHVAVLINGNGTAAAPNYSLSPSGLVLNVTDGGSGTAQITLTPVNFYSGTVTFSCTGLALDMTCTFAPATLTPVGNAPLTSTVTVTTKAPHGALRMPADPHQGRTSLLACLTGMGLFGLLLAGDWKNKRNRRVGILLGILVLGMMFSLVGCSSSTPGTPLGANTVTIPGTGSDGVANSVNITVNVF